ncbi:hypothetical protein ACU686_09705 [Yinghuangia aomiensis]
MVLGVVPFVAFTAWGLAHAVEVLNGFGHGEVPGVMATPWLVSFLLLWWVPVSWLERPRKPADAAAQASVDALTVTVQVPVYNEDPGALERACTPSLCSPGG